jgi:hypothetical protein
MDRVPRIKQLYRELSELHEKMKPFFAPQTVGHMNGHKRTRITS